MTTNPPPTMPITPAHQQVIDDALPLVFTRFYELAAALGFDAPQAVTREHVLASPLAKELRILARYAEGYDLGKGDILLNIDTIARMLFPQSMSKKGFRFPTDFHTTPLGEMVHTTLVRHYPPEQRMGVGEVTKRLGVSRQTVHGWAQDTTLTPIYEKGILTFTRMQVEDVQHQRDAKSDR